MPPSVIESLVGRRFGRLVVLERAANDKWQNTQWLCRCDCKNIIVVCRGALISGHTRSCGCLALDIRRQKTHGMTDTRPYNIWTNMMQRCYRPQNKDYNRYGGRGIIVCERWHKFENFWEDVKNIYSGDLSMDRIDNNGNYELNNIRFVDSTTQMSNTRSSVFITHNGKTQTIAQWARELGIKRELLQARLRLYHWPIEKAFQRRNYRIKHRYVELVK